MDRPILTTCVACSALALIAGCHASADSHSADAPSDASQPYVIGVGEEQQAARLATELSQRAAKGDRQPVKIHARYALAWNCPCAPIILANASATPPQSAYLLPVVQDGEANPADFAVVGEFRLFGQYAGREISLEDWVRDGGGPPNAIAKADPTHRRAPYLAFDVARWCYVPPGELPLLEEQASTDEFAARMVGIIARLRDEGRFCAPDDD